MWSNLNTTIYNSFQRHGEHVPVPFDNNDLNASKELILHHGRNTLIVIPLALFDSDGILQSQAGIFQIVDENTVKYSFSGDLDSGKYLFIFKFLYL